MYAPIARKMALDIGRSYFNECLKAIEVTAKAGGLSTIVHLNATRKEPEVSDWDMTKIEAAVELLKEHGYTTYYQAPARGSLSVFKQVEVSIQW